jgi:dipeptidyl aminopeptidase/acylaminoacyl peptidase
MPWDGSELWVGAVEDGQIRHGRLLLGGPTESVQAPVWADDTTLYVLSDRSGWWNIHRVDLADGTVGPLCPVDEEFLGPFTLWKMGGRPLTVLSDGRLAVLPGRGTLRMAVLDPHTGELTDMASPNPEFDGVVSAHGALIAAVAGGPRTPQTLLRFDIGSGGPARPSVTALRRESDADPYAAYLPNPRRLEITGPSGATVHALLYPPANPDAPPPSGARPPYVIWVHGGPTGHETCLLDLEKAYFTSRGLGVVDVNYAGSTGYGRDYRERLRGQWGILDVADVVAVASALADLGIADPDRLAVRGASAGGWTTLCAVTTGVLAHGPVFRAAVAYHGFADLATLTAHTHDFEAHYVDGLVGGPDDDLYASRSPLGHVSAKTNPILLLQGAEDAIVPPEQTESLVRALTEHGVPHESRVLPGEPHGFWRTDSIVTALRAELAFYRRHLGSPPPQP